MLSTGLNSQAIMQDFDVYPNPAISHVTIQLINVEKTGEIRLIDISGRILKQTMTNNDESRIHLDVKGLTPGFYQLQYLSEGNLLNKSLIIQ